LSRCLGGRIGLRFGPAIRPGADPGQRSAGIRGYLRAPNGVRHGTGLLVLTLAGDRICSVTRFDTSVLPSFGLPRSLPSR